MYNLLLLCGQLCIFHLQIAAIVDSYAATLTKRSDRDAFFLTTQGIVQLMQRLNRFLLLFYFYFVFIVRVENCKYLISTQDKLCLVFKNFVWNNVLVLMNYTFWLYRYRNGTRGHMKAAVQDLLRKYLAVEVLFQQGSNMILSYLFVYLRLLLFKNFLSLSSSK